MPRLLVAVAVLSIALPRPAVADVPVLVVDGRGFGHGVGMAQDGAYWMGRNGATTEQILGQFFPGTGTGRAGGNVRIPLVDAGAAPTSVALSFPTGGLVRDAPPHQPARDVDVRVPPGALVTIHFDGSRYRVTATHGASASPRAAAPATGFARLASTARTAQAGPLPTPPSSTTTTTPVPTTTPPSTTTSTTTTTTPTTAPDDGEARLSGPSSPQPLWSIPDGGGTIGVPAREGRRYRGAMQAVGDSGTLRLVNEVDVEVYLKGMGEVLDPTWPAASLRAQAVAARTYALRAMNVGGEICDTQRCQVYVGATAEYAAMAKAVNDTRGVVLTFGRQLASAVYSSNGGGHSASREEGFGETEGNYPYLRPAPYPTHDPKPWTVEVALSDVAARLAYPGQVHEVRIVATGPSGRARLVELSGSAGSQTRSGLQVARALRLRSTLFAMRTESAASAPAPPDGESFLQSPPEDAALPVGDPLPDDAMVVERMPAVPPLARGPMTRRAASVEGLALWAAVVLALVATATVAAVGGRPPRSPGRRGWISRPRAGL